MKKATENKKARKRTQFMCAGMLVWIRIRMGYERQDMCDQLGLKPRRYQSYELGDRSIPADIALQIRELYRRDREWMAGIPGRVDAAERKRNCDE